MKTYTLEVWYRCGYCGDDKDFFTTTIKANSDQQAKDKAKALRKNIFKIEITEIN